MEKLSIEKIRELLNTYLVEIDVSESELIDMINQDDVYQRMLGFVAGAAIALYGTTDAIPDGISFGKILKEG